MSRALIVGGAGFVGNYLAQYLCDSKRYEVFITKLESSEFSMNGVTAFDMDILNKSSVEHIIREIRPDVIFHLAAQSSVAASWKEPKLTIDINITGTVNLLEVVKNEEINPVILLIGSGEEYGGVSPDDIPIKETRIVDPTNLYAVTKVSQNMIGRIYARAYNTSIIMTRSFNHFGPKQPSQFVISDFCRQVAEIEKGLRKPVITVGNIEVKRDFLDVRDVASAYELLIRKGKIGEIYNVGSGNAYSIKAILERILALSDSKIKVEKDPAKFRPLDIPVIQADISKLVEDTGWKANIPFERGLSDTLNFWRANV